MSTAVPRCHSCGGKELTFEYPGFADYVAEPIGPVELLETDWQAWWSLDTPDFGFAALEKIQIMAIDRKVTAQRQLHKKYEGYAIQHWAFNDDGTVSAWIEYVQTGQETEVVYLWSDLDYEYYVQWLRIIRDEPLEFHPVDDTE
jgi:hypothetical protein